VLIVSAAAAVFMLVGVVILGGDLDDDNTGEDLNVEAAILDTAADAAAAGGVAISGETSLPPAVAIGWTPRWRWSSPW